MVLFTSLSGLVLMNASHSDKNDDAPCKGAIIALEFYSITADD